MVKMKLIQIEMRKLYISLMLWHVVKYKFRRKHNIELYLNIKDIMQRLCCDLLDILLLCCFLSIQNYITSPGLAVHSIMNIKHGIL